jgi:uncharacterized protein DUF3137
VVEIAASLDATGGFDSPGDAPLERVLVGLEQRRKRVIASYCCTVLALIVAIPIAAAPLLLLAFDPSQVPSWLTPHLPTIGLVGAVALFVTLLVGLWAFRRFAWLAKLRYLHDYKTQVFAAVCRHHFPGLRYLPDGGMPFRLLDESQLFPFACDVYTSEDRFEGQVGATDICFSEAKAQRERRRGFGQNRETVYETYFRGIVFSADFQKHFRSTTRLLPKGADRNRVARESVAELEDPSFNDVFDTLTTDQVDVRYVLSPSLMERLTTLAARFRGLRALFADGRLLLLLPTNRNRFEASLLERADNQGQIDSFIADAAACLGIVEALDLNTRIWSKS